jgi:hypothetical protein
MIFETPNEWILETIRFALIHTEIDWFIRIHPGEMENESVVTTSSVIRQFFPKLPSHITLIDEFDRRNFLSLAKSINLVITIFGTVGIELAVFGKSVICAGDAFYGKKGFTIDPINKEDYFEKILLHCNDVALSDTKIALAKKYAYQFFLIEPKYFWKESKRDKHWDLPKIRSLLKIFFELDREHKNLIRYLLD